MTTPGRLEALLGYTFRDRGLLGKALVQASARNEGLAKDDNRRLAFLGDAVLELVVRQRGYLDPSLPRKSLTEWKQQFTRNSAIASVLEGLDESLVVGRGERANDKGKVRRTADAFEALVGAMWLDEKAESLSAIEQLLFPAP